MNLKISISTENGTGSFTANKILMRSLLKSGYYVSAKNLFPSNIAGLPTLYKLRISSKKQGSVTSETPDLLVAFNKKTFEKDLEKTNADSFVISNADFKLTPEANENLCIECRKLTRPLHDSASVKKLLYNMIYVGAVLKLTDSCIETALEVTDGLLKKLNPKALEANKEALKIGFDLAQDFSIKSIEKNNDVSSAKIVGDGNYCSALGFIDGGAQVLTWYPITPSSAAAENFESFSKLSPNHSKRNIVQCEDEISSVVAALGASWSGARAFTATSGPGVSLMQEAIGLAYFTETPLSILNVQRLGPSTGLPTRTSQGDLNLCHYSSHGDTQHPVLLPSSLQDSYDDAFSSVNLAQEIQSPVFVLTDLDLSMNEWEEPFLKQQKLKNTKGQIQTEPCEDFKRYSNQKEVSKRSLPLISDASLAYFTRGTGHKEDGSYSEAPDDYQKKVSRLKSKILNIRDLSSFVPKDQVDKSDGADLALIYYGSSSQIIPEVQERIGVKTSTYKVRALPLNKDLKTFCSQHKKVFVIEQNRDGQLNQILKSELNITNTESVVQFNGQPIDPIFISQKIKELL